MLKVGGSILTLCWSGHTLEQVLEASHGNVALISVFVSVFSGFGFVSLVTFSGMTKLRLHSSSWRKTGGPAESGVWQHASDSDQQSND